MRVRVKLPKIGMTMEEATVVRFCKQPGEAFSKGDPLYEIETEKISQEVEATGDGVMVEHSVPEGSDVRVGESGLRGRDRPDSRVRPMAAPSLPQLFHIGWVVRDCAAAQQELSARLGAGPFLSMGDDSTFDQTLVHGKPVPFSLKIAFGQLGGVLLELLQPLDDRSPHAEFLAERGEGMHHLAYVVADFDDQLAAIRAADPAAQLLSRRNRPGKPVPLGLHGRRQRTRDGDRAMGAHPPVGSPLHQRP